MRDGIRSTLRPPGTFTPPTAPPEPEQRANPVDVAAAVLLLAVTLVLLACSPALVVMIWRIAL